MIRAARRACRPSSRSRWRRASPTATPCWRRPAQAGTKLGVISQRRWYEPVRRMKAAIDAGKIGRPILGVFAMYSWRDQAYYQSDPWRGKWDTEGGGVLVNQSPHQLDLLHWFMGDDRRDQRLLGQPQSSLHRGRGHRRRDDPLQDRRASAPSSPACRSGRASTPRSTSTAPTARRSASRPTAARRSSPACREIAEPPLNDLWTIPGEEHLLARFQAEDRARFAAVDATTHYHALQIQDFLQAVRDDRAPLVTGEDGRVVVEMFTAIYRSQRERIPIRFPLNT